MKRWRNTAQEGNPVKNFVLSSFPCMVLTPNFTLLSEFSHWDCKILPWIPVSGNAIASVFSGTSAASSLPGTTALCPVSPSTSKPIKAQACFFTNPIGATHHTAVVHHLQLLFSNARLGGTGSLYMQPPSLAPSACAVRTRATHCALFPPCIMYQGAWSTSSRVIARNNINIPSQCSVETIYIHGVLYFRMST